MLCPYLKPGQAASNNDDDDDDDDDNDINNNDLSVRPIHNLPFL
jgi:hypothetical protein